MTTESLVEASRPISSRSTLLRDTASLDPLMQRIGDAHYVLLGEASHGTSEYYTWRTRISQRLIEEKGFRFIAVEGDWPDCYELNRYVKGWSGHGQTARDVLRRFDRWPTWMWANWEVVALAEWLREYNMGRAEEDKVGFYGLDVYSLWESLDAIYRHIRQYHPEHMENALAALTCFEPFGREGQDYALHTRLVAEDCEDEVIELLAKLRAVRPNYPDDPEEHFNAEQNALVAVDAERYYRAMVRSDDMSWNVRDVHMADTLDRLVTHHGEGAKAIVWEHNTHIGDARATDMANSGMVNIGQLVRERHSREDTVLVGFGAYGGSVIAGSRWGSPMEIIPIPDAIKGSWEWMLHQANARDRLLITNRFEDVREFDETHGHRAIGVVYHPERERYGNYVPTRLGDRYDAFLYFDRTEALHPLHIHERAAHEMPETYPWGE